MKYAFSSKLFESIFVFYKQTNRILCEGFFFSMKFGQRSEGGEGGKWDDAPEQKGKIFTH